MRTGDQAIDWARGHAARPPRGYGASDGTWYRMCLQYVRAAYGLPAVYPDAGTAWDRAERKRHTTDAGSIPRGVPVFWELPSVADHVAISTGGGWCWSTDAAHRGRANKVRIDEITRAWGGRLLGWTEDLNGRRIWTPPVKRTPNITAALEARTRAERIVALEKVAAKGGPRAKAAATDWLAALAAKRDANLRAKAAREALKALER